MTQPAARTRQMSSLFELQVLTGTDLQQAADLLNVCTKTFCEWMSGSPMEPDASHHLNEILRVMRFCDRGLTPLNRAALQLPGPEGTAFDLLRDEQYDSAASLMGPGQGRPASLTLPLSEEARRLRQPLPLEQLLGANQDPLPKVQPSRNESWRVRAPMPMEQIVDALHDRVHTQPAGSRPARIARAKGK